MRGLIGYLIIALSFSSTSFAGDVGEAITDLEELLRGVQSQQYSCVNSSAAEKSCSVIFSVLPPPQFPEFNERNWLPFCSVHNLNRSHLLHREYSRSQQFEEAKLREFATDGCAPAKERLEAVLKIRKGNGPNVTDIVQPMSEQQKNSYLNTVLRRLKREAEACCGPNDPECISLVSNVTIEWCEPPTDPKEENTCLTEPAIFGRSADGDLARLPAAPSADQLKNLKLDSGVIFLSPLAYSSGEPLAPIATVEHEIGHACASAHLQLRVKREGLSALAMARENDAANPDTGENCAISPSSRLSYQALFQHIGVSDKSISCLFDLANATNTQRFRDVTCAASCPLIAIDEAFADFLRLTVLNVDEGKNYLRYSCREGRDNKHVLPADEISCALSTPLLREKFFSWSACSLP